MHRDVLEWVQRWATSGPKNVLDVGGRDINGHGRYLFDSTSTFEIIDLVEAPEVTWVGDVLDFGSVETFDVALYLEVAEHTAEWPEHIRHISHLVDPHGGLFIFTAAGYGRAPHSAADGGRLQPGEHYQNISPDALAGVLDTCFSKHVLDIHGEDVRAAAWR